MEPLDSLDIVVWVGTLSMISYIMTPIVAAGARALRRAAFDRPRTLVAAQDVLPVDVDIRGSFDTEAASPLTPIRVRRNYRRQHSAVSYRYNQRKAGCQLSGDQSQQ